jgi:hypothetical protein
MAGGKKSFMISPSKARETPGWIRFRSAPGFSASPGTGQNSLEPMNIIDAGSKGEGAKISQTRKLPGEPRSGRGCLILKKGEAKTSPFFLTDY